MMYLKVLIRFVATTKILLGFSFLSLFGAAAVISNSSVGVTAGSKIVGVLGITYLILYVFNGIGLFRMKRSALFRETILDVIMTVFVLLITLRMFSVENSSSIGMDYAKYQFPAFLAALSCLFLFFFSRKKVRDNFL